MTCPVLANSGDPDQLASDLDLHCLSLNMWISIKNPDQSDGLEIKSGSGILIYSAWQELNLSFNSIEVISSLFAQAFLSEYLG